MPGTWAEVCHRLGYGSVSPHVARYAIEAGVYYMRSLRNQWSSPRPADDRQRLAQASYNTGMGNMLKAQKRCGGLPHWEDIAPCLPAVTGAKGAAETANYIRMIAYWRSLMGAN
jgi:soluble lytic murein transglycosylase-like protein